VDLKEKVEQALRNHFQVEQIRLVDDDGISGYVVSPDFKGVETVDRQDRIARALRDPSVKLTRREQRRVLLIAPWTPVEFDLLVPNGDDEVDTHAQNGAGESFAGLISKVEHLLRSRFRVDHLRLEDENGIYGTVVSPDFEGLSMANREDLINRTLREPSSNFTDSERRQVKFIWMYTPAEYGAKLSWD
jgi:stress-induced morphogen